MNGVTGRMGTNQHLRRSILSIRRDGGLEIPGIGRILPEPVLVGRNPVKLERLSRETGVEAWTDRLDRALEDPANRIYFDAQTTPLRAAAMERALEAGCHVYCEKPAAATSAEALRLYRMAQRCGLRHGVVQDKLWVPGIVRLKRLLRDGSLGRILSVRGEFGYWVFDGRDARLQRPSWNYRKEEGGSIILDMFPHWRYLLENLFGRVRAVSCLGATHVRRRWNEAGREYAVTADDSAYATFLLEGGVVAHFNSSWAVSRAPGRPLHPASRRNSGIGRMRLEPLLGATRRLHPPGDLESGPGAVAGVAGIVVARTRASSRVRSLPDAVGTVPAPCSCRRAVPLEHAGGSQGGPVGRVRPRVVAKPCLGRYPRVAAGIRLSGLSWRRELRPVVQAQ